MLMTHVATNMTDGLKVRAEMHPLGNSKHITVTVSSAAAHPVDGWAIDLTLPAAIVGVTNARYEPLGASRYRITPDRWHQSIPAGGTVEFGILLAN